MNEETTTHILDGSNVVADIKGGAVSKYNRGRGLISIEQNGNKGYYTFNGHGDVIGIVDSNGDMKNQTWFYAYGYEIYQTATVFDNPFRYAGEYTDAETGNIYLRARYHDPNTGRFVSEDPIRDGANWYVYAGNNPVMFVDPTGFWAADGSDERFKESNPIVYNAISDLSDTWARLDYIEKTQVVDRKIDIASMKNDVKMLTDKVRAIGDAIKVSEPIVGSKLNSVEKVLYNYDSRKGFDVMSAGMTARQVTDNKYGEGHGYDTDNCADAYRHAFWNAAATVMVGSEYTYLWTAAHEYGYPSNITVNGISATYMDLYNNGLGRIIGNALGLGSNDDSVVNAVSNAVHNGELLKIVDKKLVPTS